MSVVKIAENIYSVGVVDWNMRTFHGNTYITRRGTTYNAYLIVDDTITLVDTVKEEFTNELLDNIRQIVDPSRIGAIIANHVEMDHSGALPAVLKQCPNAKVYGTARCKEGLSKYYYLDMDFHAVKTGDTLKIGKRTLQFIEAPMIHWPDSMFTYVQGDGILMPNDAFGQHLASSQRFDDEVDNAILKEESSKYYANILWPFGSMIARKIEEIQKLNIPLTMIAPSHGVIWRKDPGAIVESYGHWTKNETKKKVVVFYETMWGSTEKMARSMMNALEDAGVPATLYDITKVDRTELTNDMLDARGYLIGSSTHDNDMLPTIGGFLGFFKGLKPKGRVAGVFGSFGWGGGAVQSMEKTLKEAGVELPQPSLAVRFAPSPDELKASYDFAKTFVEKL